MGCLPEQSSRHAQVPTHLSKRTWLMTIKCNLSYPVDTVFVWCLSDVL